MTNNHLEGDEGERGRQREEQGRNKMKGRKEEGGRRRKERNSPNFQKVHGPSSPLPTSPSRSSPSTTPG
jgi:hypothetical protein